MIGSNAWIFIATEPWLLTGLYVGSLRVYHTESQQLLKEFEVSDHPIRCVKFISRKNWIICGSDDMIIRVFNYNTHDKVMAFEAHSDYIRSLAIHPTQPYVISCSDDMSIRVWDWEQKWKCILSLEGHSHYVMQVVFNPKDSNTFASASLDRTIKVWSLGSTQPNYTLEGHEKGVNCLDYYQGGEKPYLVSGADDRTVKIWDYQNRSCIQTLEGHTHNISSVCFYTELPLILTGSEDGMVRIWHANTYRLETTLNYGLERVWALASIKGSNEIAIGYDHGTVIIKMGREEPAISMDNSGKIIWAKHTEIITSNVKSTGDADVKDGERLILPMKELGSCEIYPQTLQHNPNGRFVAVCGDGEYIIYTSLAWRSKTFGNALEFVWGSDSSHYALRESTTRVKICENFKESALIKPIYGAEGLFGGTLLGIRSTSYLCLYDWTSTTMIRRIDVVPKNVSVPGVHVGDLCSN